MDGRLNRHARYTAYLRERYNGHVLATPIRTSSSLAVASRDGRTVFDAKTMTRGALDYAHSTAEIAGGSSFPLSPRPPRFRERLTLAKISMTRCLLGSPLCDRGARGISASGDLANCDLASGGASG